MQGRSQDLVSGGHSFRGGRPPIIRLRPQINRVLCTFGYPRISPPPLGYALGQMNGDQNRRVSLWSQLEGLSVSELR